MKIRTIFKTIGLIAILFVFIATPSAAALAANAGQEADPVLGEAPLYVIGLISTVLVYVLNQLAARKVKIHRGVLTIGLFILSWALAVAWGGVVLPTFASFSDPVSFVSAAMQYITDLIVAIGPSFTVGTLIYNIFMKRLLDAGFEKLTSVASK